MENWNLRLRVFLFFALIAVGVVASMGAAFFYVVPKVPEDTVKVLVLGFGGAGCAVVGLVIWVWMQFDENMAKPILAFGSGLRAVVHGGARREESVKRGRYLGFLGPAIAEATVALQEARAEKDRQIEAATAEADRQRRQLEAVLRDLQEGVVICNLHHSVLLYNQRALDILNVVGALGLGRSFFDLVAPGPFEHSLARLKRRFEEQRHHDHPEGLTALTVGATKGGEFVLEARIALTIDAAGEKPVGYVVAFDEVTQELDAGVKRDRLLHDGTEDIRRGMANVLGIAELFIMAPDLDEAARVDAQQRLEAERAAVDERLRALDEAASDLLAGAWPMAPIHARSLASMYHERTGKTDKVSIDERVDDVWLRCDSASVLELLSMLRKRIEHSTGVSNVHVQIRERAGRAYVDLGWSGRLANEAELRTWLEERLPDSFGALSGRDVLNRHQTEVWAHQDPDGVSSIRMPLNRVDQVKLPAPAARPKIEARPEFYDFDLFGRVPPKEQREARLRDLTYVVFDTETTGLEPQRGDEMISIAGVRVVNGRVLRGESFNRFANPGRKIPAASTKIHGITDADVADAETVDRVLARFKVFAGDAVLVAHNAAFDMSFLTRREATAGVVFDNAVLDTVLLAAHVFGSSESLTLDTLAAKFDVILEERDRHTALGDSLATAEVLMRLIALLEAEGVKTLQDAFDMSEQQSTLRRRQSAAYS